MICKQCGAQIDDNAAECKFCGMQYADNAESVNSKAAETPAEEVPGVDTGLDAETEMLFDENEIKRKKQIEKIKAEKQNQLEEIEKRRKDKKIKQRRIKIITILIAVLCVGAAAFGGYYVFNMNANKTANEPEVIITPDSTVKPTPQPTVTAAPQPSETPTPEITPTTAPSETANNAASTSGSASSAAVKKPSATQKPVSDSKTSSAQNASAVQKPAVTAKPTAAPKPAATAKPAAQQVATSSATMGGTEYNAEGGMNGDEFTSALVTGIEVVKSDDKAYMAFKYNGGTYYAKVSGNTTTGFVAGKAMTISAYKISETYNGVNVYEITAITHYNGNYIFPNSGFKLLTENDLKGKSALELRLGRNEIYARHGRKFNDLSLQAYFNGCSWYAVKSSYNYGNDADNLNAIERANAKFIKDYEKSHN